MRESLQIRLEAGIGALARANHGDARAVESRVRGEAPPHETQPDYALHGRINALQKLLDRQYVEKNQHFQQG